MKFIIKYIICLCILALGMSSCLDNDKTVNGIWRNIATVDNFEVSPTAFTLDDGTKLTISPSSAISYKPKYDRVIIDYMLLDENSKSFSNTGGETKQQYIMLYDIYDVLTKKPVYIPTDDQYKQDSIGYDPVKILQVWEGGGYLNFYFAVSTSGGEVSHLINLLSDKPIDKGLNGDVVKLEFRHNKMGDIGGYNAYSYVSFDLEPYRTAEGGTIKFDISWTDMESGTVKSYPVEYTYTGQKNRGGVKSPAISILSREINLK